MTKFFLDARTATDRFPGVGRYVANLARALLPLLEGDEVLHLLTAPGSRSGIDDLRRAVEDPDHGRLRFLETSASPLGLAQQWRIPPLVRDAAAYHSPYYLFPYRTAAPTVLTVLDLIPWLLPGTVSRRARLAFRPAMRLALRAARHVICISESTRRDLLAFQPLDPSTVSVAPLAPAPQFRPLEPEARSTIRRRHALPEAFVLYVGTNKPHKNLVRLVEAWAQVSTDVPLVIAGRWDPRHPEARVRAGQLGLDRRVRFLGPVPDAELPALYSACTLFVYPSRHEGFGLPVVEAMACGAAIACSRAASLPEVGGKAVSYFDPDDTGEMARDLSRLLGDDAARAELRVAAVARAGSFSWSRTAAGTLGAYRAIARSGTR